MDMKTLYFECKMGAAGDMLGAALLELFENREGMVEALNRIGIPEVRFEALRVEKAGIFGTRLSVRIHGAEEAEVSDDNHAHHHDHHHCHHHDHDHEHEHDHGDEHEHPHHHAHRGMTEIRSIIEGLSVSEKVKTDALAVYRLIADAESKAHQVPVAQIHFHEVGAMDAIADIVAVCCMIEKLSPDQIVVSPIHLGSGVVRCAHGVLPVPAPATAEILLGVPTYGGEIDGELCTPTGAALLKYFASRFGPQPPMVTERIGYGMGKKNFRIANCVRAFYGVSAA